MASQIWTYRDTTITQRNLSGLSVEAIDGKIGKVDDATNDVGASFIVVDTGPWIFGKKVMLPAGVVRDVDMDTETVFVEPHEGPDQGRARVRRGHVPRSDQPRCLSRSAR